MLLLIIFLLPRKPPLPAPPSLTLRRQVRIREKKRNPKQNKTNNNKSLREIEET